MTLRITIELVPYGEEEYKRTISLANIHNITPGGNICDYRIEITGDSIKGEKQFVLNGIKRDNSGFWPILSRICEKMMA